MKLFIAFAVFLISALNAMESPILVTMPKSGTHLTIYLVNAMAQEMNEACKMSWAHVEFRKRIQSLCDLFPDRPKILLVRNLKDRLISSKDFNVTIPPRWWIPYLAIHGKDAWFALKEEERISHTIHFLKYKLRNDAEDALWFANEYPDALIIHFEELFNDKDQVQPKTVEIIAKHLGLNFTRNAIKRIINKVYGLKNAYGEAGSFIKQKKLYRHREQFTPKNYEEFEYYFGDIEEEFNAFFGYGKEGTPLHLLSHPDSNLDEKKLKKNCKGNPG